MKVNIQLIGCDDATIFDLEMSNEEYEFLKLVSRISYDTSSYNCMPVMKLEVIEED